MPPLGIPYYSLNRINSIWPPRHIGKKVYCSIILIEGLTVVCETKWSETKRNETKRNEMERNEMKICSLRNENL